MKKHKLMVLAILIAFTNAVFFIRAIVMIANGPLSLLLSSLLIGSISIIQAAVSYVFIIPLFTQALKYKKIFEVSTSIDSVYKVFGFLPIKIAIPMGIIFLSGVIFYLRDSIGANTSTIITTLIIGTCAILWGTIVFVKDLIKN